MSLMQFCPNWKTCDCDNCVLYRTVKENDRIREIEEQASKDQSGEH